MTSAVLDYERDKISEEATGLKPDRNHGDRGGAGHRGESKANQSMIERARSRALGRPSLV